ncbi:glycosyltransferase family 92 protein C35A5.5-like [Osmerus eperlanus]|uniref:glycosyltransferase family 92 protein C35A5.5-like n=1 Tax=Osmerus eperlanus TaxID=29151 RepID=UPI002E110C69
MIASNYKNNSVIRFDHPTQMQRIKLQWKVILILIYAVACMVLFGFITRMKSYYAVPTKSEDLCLSLHVSNETLTPLTGTRHLLVSAYLECRLEENVVRIISVFKRDSVRDLFCVFCCMGNMSTTLPAQVLMHSDHFGFPFVTTDILCKIPAYCSIVQYVTLMPHANVNSTLKQTFLPIKNLQSGQKKEEDYHYQFNFTVCISNLFENYNNVLQFTQSLEMYRLLGVGRVVVYNTSCGPELDMLLKSYSQEGFVEVLPWPIELYLTPSPGWKPDQGGELHYYGQLATLNDCVYRYMYLSHYVLLNDIDEIIVPYQHTSLNSAFDMLQRQYPQAGVFMIQNHIFPNTQFDLSGRYHVPYWEGVPGVNILEHIYREEPNWKQTSNKSHPFKMVVQPRVVEQTSVHSVLHSFKDVVEVPPEVCRIIHVRVALQKALTKNELHQDTRLWDYHRQLVPNVDKALRRAGLLT